MFIVSISYKKPLEEVDKIIEAHVDYLKKYYREGIFLLSGRKEPQTGGIILAEADSREILDKILQQDPFSLAGLTDYEVTKFLPTMASDDLKSLLE